MITLALCITAGTLFVLWMGYSGWSAPLMKENEDGSWTTLQPQKKFSDLFKKQTPKKKVLYVILHTQHQPDRFDWITKTWVNGVDYIFISDKEDLEKNIIKVSDSSDYDSCEEKQINSANLLSSKELEFDFYFFCSNDNFVNTKKMDEFIQYCETDFVWGELDNAWPSDPTLYFALGGAGVLVSKEIMKKINGTMQWANKSHPSAFPSDVSMCINFVDKNIEIKNSELLHHQTFEHWCEKHYPHNVIDYSKIKEHISFHYIKNFETMNLYYKSCK